MKNEYEDDQTHQVNHVIHFKLPKGYKGGAYVHNHSQSICEHEHEYLMKPDQKFKVISHEQKPGPHRTSHIWTVTPHK